MIDKDLKIYDSVCTGCSACTEVCAFPDEEGINPIQLVLNDKGLAVPRINNDTCTECMMCYKACPTEDKLYNNDVTFDAYKKQIGECYFGYSLDNEHRFKSATAGITTEIAAYLLDTQTVDGVVSSYQDDDNQIVTEIFTDSQEVKKSRGSIYRQVSLLNNLAEKIEAGGFKKLLVVGLSCHIEGLKTLHQTNKYLKKNVEFITIALFCKQTKTEEFSNIERSMLGAKQNQKINYRGKGWPGITSVNGAKSLPSTNIKFSMMWATFAFTPDYCFTCSDPLGIIADISIGDAWLHKYYADKSGSSLIVANTPIGKSIIKSMSNTKKIFIDPETKENVIVSQNEQMVRYKTENIEYRKSLFSNTNGTNSTDKKYKRLSQFILVQKNIFENLYHYNIVSYIPNIFLKIYTKLASLLKRL